MKNRILKLVNSPAFQELKSYHGDVERTEKPLKLFLRLAATKSLGRWTFGIDGFDGAFYNRVLAGNYNVELRWPVFELSYEEDGNTERRIIAFVIENKEDQGLVERYFNAVTACRRVEDAKLSPMGILLTEEPTQPSCSQFDNITYKELSTYVIEPLVSKAGHDTALQHLVDNNREIFDTAFASLYKPSVVEKILDKNSKVLEVTDEDVNVLRMLWDANEEIFEAAIQHLYSEHKSTLDKLFKPLTGCGCKYIVYHQGQAIFPNKPLSKAMAACAIFKAYLKEYPATTLNELQRAFPCEELNGYYYGRYYNDLFDASDPDAIDESGYPVARWDFYIDDEQLLPIENGTKKAMCVKVWRKTDFNSLLNHLHAKGYDKFITVQEI